ncbi:hypothetical protein SLEP1_g55887 [Rubroshorea leprosula]|uniref:Uncharacterized protein n=1 Tax=Rubroshorea leprosula TaxID=152421 RepID=A0AAV5MKZ7_9ROSI|nr:hypothetical protein SLEP1_g55887 [Rubroshorea leprosula]
MDPVEQANQESDDDDQSFFAQFLRGAPTENGPLERVIVMMIHYFVTQLLTRYRSELGIKKAMLDGLQKESLLKPPCRLEILPQSLSNKHKEKMNDLKAEIEVSDADLQMLLKHITYTVFDNYHLCNSLQILDVDEYSPLMYVQSIFPEIVQIPIEYIGHFHNEQEAHADGFQTI